MNAVTVMTVQDKTPAEWLRFTVANEGVHLTPAEMDTHNVGNTGETFWVAVHTQQGGRVVTTVVPSGSTYAQEGEFVAYRNNGEVQQFHTFWDAYLWAGGDEMKGIAAPAMSIVKRLLGVFRG
jgi:ketosteroid isomerase-like protein